MFARFSLALASATLLLAAPASAQSEAVSVMVSAADLDLATERGRARLDRRIRRAADQICDNRSGGLAARMSYVTCREETLAAAGRDVARLAANRTGEIRLARNAR